jgi:osmotically-inducible protein OsmY
MTRNGRLGALACVAVLTHLLSACSAYSAYRKCGYAGCPGDTQITAEVRTLLDRHADLGPPNRIYVHTIDRVVYLSGEVATDLQRETAESLAHEAGGARRVVDIVSLEYNGR